MHEFTDDAARGRVQMEVVKRNNHMSKHLARTHQWKALWDSIRGWHPELKPRATEKAQ